MISYNAKDQDLRDIMDINEAIFMYFTQRMAHGDTVYV